ncbi:MAG: hypothetical protein RI897_3868 [Verrucomicrobiota bacterium]
MEAVDILGNEREGAELGDFGEAEVGRVRLATEDGFSAPGVPFPDDFGVLEEALWGGEILGWVIGPEAGLGIAEGGDSAFGGDAGSGEAGNGFGVAEESEEFFGEHGAQCLI